MNWLATDSPDLVSSYEKMYPQRRPKKQKPATESDSNQLRLILA
jgi:hypothetical protein